ncbi:MAG: glycosyltransferase, partial [Desulfovibrio sp.]|nr:glycosyltransferase [Desulfovibrio sp.]
MASTPVFSVIIPVFNKWELTAQCLKSLHRTTTAIPFEVIVVDNASCDATVTELDTLGHALFHDAFRSIHLPENINFGPACNLAAKEAAANLLFFLNNDTIATHRWVNPLLSTLEQETSVAAVGPLLLYANDTVQHVGVAFSCRHLLHIYQHFPSDHPVIAKRRSVQTLTAAAI